MLCLWAILVVGCQSGPPSVRGVSEAVPNTSLAESLGRWPNEEDLSRLESTKGKTKRQVIAILGHPKEVSFNPEGVEIWDYPWLAACRIWFKKGVVSDTYYTAGY